MAPRDPWANLSAAFASEFGSAVQWTPELIGAMATAVAGNRAELDAMQAERDSRQFCGHCGTLKTGPECCDESHFMTGQQFHQAHGYWPGDY